VVVPGASADVEFEEDSLLLAVRNVGRGAAYYVDAALGVDGMYTPADPSTLASGRVQSLAVLPIDDRLGLFFALHDGGPPSEAEVLIDYADLNGRPYSTRIVLDTINVATALRISRVELSDNRERIPWKPWTWEPETRKEWLTSKLGRRKRPPY
jgi:hypothetical protein